VFSRFPFASGKLRRLTCRSGRTRNDTFLSYRWSLQFFQENFCHVLRFPQWITLISIYLSVVVLLLQPLQPRASCIQSCNIAISCRYGSAVPGSPRNAINWPGHIDLRDVPKNVDMSVQMSRWPIESTVSNIDPRIRYEWFRAPLTHKHACYSLTQPRGRCSEVALRSAQTQHQTECCVVLAATCRHLPKRQREIAHRAHRQMCIWRKMSTLRLQDYNATDIRSSLSSININNVICAPASSNRVPRVVIVGHYCK